MSDYKIEITKHDRWMFEVQDAVTGQTIHIDEAESLDDCFQDIKEAIALAQDIEEQTEENDIDYLEERIESLEERLSATELSLATLSALVASQTPRITIDPSHPPYTPLWPGPVWTETKIMPSTLDYGK